MELLKQEEEDLRRLSNSEPCVIYGPQRYGYVSQMNWLEIISLYDDPATQKEEDSYFTTAG